MDLHPTGTDPTPTAHVVCRNARWNLLVLLAVLWAFPTVAWVAGAPWWFIGLLTACPVLLTWPLIGAWRKRGRRDNWVVAVGSDGLWLNLRDCEYHEAAPGQTVVFIPYRELAGVRQVTHRYTTPSSKGGSVQHRDLYLEVQLKTTATAELQRAIADERQRDPPARHYFGGQVTSRTRRTQTAIEWEGAAALRVKYSAGNYGLRPPLGTVLKRLERFVAVGPELRIDAENWRELAGFELDELVRRLATGGQRIQAMTLLERRKGMTAKEAKEHVDGLCRAQGGPVA